MSRGWNLARVPDQERSWGEPADPEAAEGDLGRADGSERNGPKNVRRMATRA